MKNLFGKTLFMGVLFFLVISIPAPVRADVTVKRYVEFGGVGGGMMASKSTDVDYIKGLKKCTRSHFEFTGKVLGFLSGKKDTSTVYLVKKDIVWNIDHKKKTYTQKTISIPKSKDEGSSRGRSDRNQRQEAKKEKEQVKIIKNEMKMRKTGKKKTINGYHCEEYLFTWLVETEDIETKERSKSLMTGDFWNTKVTRSIKKLQNEEKTFSLAYMKKMGFNFPPGFMKNFGLNILGSLQHAQGKNLTKEMKKMKGYPIATTIKWESSGDSAKNKEKAGEEEEEAPKSLTGALGGFFKKSVKKLATKKEKKKGDMKTVFTSYIEIKSISTASIAGSQFQVPAGYKKR